MGIVWVFVGGLRATARKARIARISRLRPNSVTILCDKYSGHPKGFAYIEFSDKESVRTSMALDESLFRGRQIKVIPKRTNRPGISSTDRGFPRGRFRGRGGGYGSARSRFYSGYARPRARGYRGRSRATSWYSPY
uniref:Uncharacterized protein n=1 Tax=Geospiza parvula TaxID=87175 RepID=A0A8C3NED1_GEOPR